MQKPPKPSSEERRLETLKNYAILDSVPESVFDNITLLASQICGTPIALISLIDEDRQWFKSKRGLDAQETPRDISFCGHAIGAGQEVFEVPNSFDDKRFLDNPLVTGGPNVVFYAGAPLMAPNGELMGTLCVIDHKPKQLSVEQRDALKALAEQVMALFQSRRNSQILLEQQERERAIAGAAEKTRKNLQLVFDISPAGMAIVRQPHFVFEKVNGAFMQLVGPREYVARNFADVFEDFPDFPFIDAMKIVYKDGKRRFDKEAALKVPGSDGKLAKRFYNISYARLDGVDDSDHGILIQLIDVTDDVRAREALYQKNELIFETQRLLAAATKVAKVGFFEWKIAENVVTFSEQMQEDWGIKANVPLETIFQQILPEDREETLRKIQSSVDSRTPYISEYRIRRPGQEGFTWIEAQGEVTFDESGRPLTFLGTSVNITARKNAEHEVQAIANSIPQLAWTADATGYVSWYNRRWYDYTGTNFEEMAGWGWGSVIDPDHLVRVIGKYRECLESGENWEDVFPIRGADGKYRWFLSQATPIRDENGKIKRWFGANTDITTQKENEDARTRLAAVVESSRDFIGMTDAHFKPIFLNRGGRAMTGFGERDITQANLEQFFSPRDIPRIKDEVYPAAQSKGYWEGELSFRHFETGRPIPVLYNLFPIRDEKSGATIGYATVTRDISDRKLFELNLEESRDAAEKANSAKSVFLANMSHEIRSPLGAIMGFSELIKSSDITKDELSNFISIVDRNSNHVLRIIDDILDLSKVEAGKMLVEHIVFSLPDLLADFSSLMGLRARDKGIDFELRIPTKIPEKAISDPTRLRQILNNVVGNALKFTERGRVQMTVLFEDGKLRFVVTDTGIGLEKTQADKLFQAFQQADVSTTRKFGGTGLGLVLTRRIAELMGGEFYLEKSELGQGSTFVASVLIKLMPGTKMVDSAGLEFATTVAKAKEPAKPLNGLRILVIEDSPDNQALFEILLTKLGATIEIGKDGHEGVELSRTGTYDVVLCDVQMPRMDGYEVIAELKKRDFKVPVVALTAHAMKEERDRALKAGFTDFLSKPIHKEALIETLLRVTRVPLRDS